MKGPYSCFLTLAGLALAACVADVDAIDVDPDAPTEGDTNVSDDPNADPGSDDGLTIQQAAVSGLVDSEEAAFLTQINDYRTAHGVAKLKISIALTHSAQNHSTDMANNNYFAHNSQDGTDPFTRMRRAGYTYSTALGENIAAGVVDAPSAFVAWRDACDAVNGACTYAHRKNMLSTDYKVLGIGRAYNASAAYGWYWTTDFGGYVDAVFSYGTGTIIVNGGFESAPLGTSAWSGVRTRGGWYVYNSARSTGGPLAGSYEMQVKDPDPGAANVTQIVLGAPGIVYTFTGSSKRLSGTSAQSLYLEFLDGNYARLSVATVPSAAGSTYASAAVSRTAPAGTKYVRVFPYGGAASGVHSTFAYDSMKVTAE